MHRLTNPIRNYAWGSRTHIPKMRGLPASEEPVAEVWFGAHPVDPSRVEDGRRLDDLIAELPRTALGDRVAESFRDRLPFMMKLLAASEPLSLQVHPTSEQARMRYTEQNAAGIPLDSPERSYRDPSNKPELIYALTRFEGMAGFRDTDKTAMILRKLQLPWVDEIANELEGTLTPSKTLRCTVTRLLAMSGPELNNRLHQLANAAKDAEDRAHAPRVRRRPPHVAPSSVDRESLRVFAQTPSLVEKYPEDPGVLVTLLLNHVVLAAGEAMFVAAGTIHAYTSGFGVEIMAASDNVVRAGLTPKYVNIPELLTTADFTPMPPPRWEGARMPDSSGILLAPPVSEFELVVTTVAGKTTAHDARPMIVLCLDGSVEVSSDQVTERIVSGEAVFVEYVDGRVALTGEGRVALGRTPA